MAAPLPTSSSSSSNLNKPESTLFARCSWKSTIYRVVIVPLGVLGSVTSIAATLVICLQMLNNMKYADPEIPPDLIVNQVYGSALLCISCLTVLIFMAIIAEMIFITLRYINYRGVVEIYSDELVHESKLEEYDNCRFDADRRVALVCPAGATPDNTTGTTGVIEFTEDAPSTKKRAAAPLTEPSNKNVSVVKNPKKKIEDKTMDALKDIENLLDMNSFVGADAKKGSKMQTLGSKDFPKSKMSNEKMSGEKVSTEKPSKPKKLRNKDGTKELKVLRTQASSEDVRTSAEKVAPAAAPKADEKTQAMTVTPAPPAVTEVNKKETAKNAPEMKSESQSSHHTLTAAPVPDANSNETPAPKQETAKPPNT